MRQVLGLWGEGQYSDVQYERIFLSMYAYPDSTCAMAGSKKAQAQAPAQPDRNGERLSESCFLRAIHIARSLALWLLPSS